MKKIFSLLLVGTLIIALPVVARAGVSASQSFRISVTIPPHISMTTPLTLEQPTNQNLGKASVIEYDLRTMIWTEIVRNDEKIMMQSIVLR